MSLIQSIPLHVAFRAKPTMYFIGVTTGKSSINQVFPLWMKELGHEEIVLEGIDHPIHDDPQAYRKTVEQIKFDPQSLGALVTTHKMDLYAAARDLFEYLDPYATLCSELSSISKQGNRLEGHAKDPISAGLSMDAITGEGYFGKTGGHVLIFGAGGSSLATVLHLINKKDKKNRPDRIIVVNRSQPRLDHMQQMVSGLQTDIQMEYILNSNPSINDQIMERIPAGSVVVNATGMGKDIPGSPVSNSGKFPENGIALEFNYRGELDFLHQARDQEEKRQLRIEDGWEYFLHGWTQVIVQVLHIDLTPDLFKKLSLAAEIVHQ